MEVLSMLCIHDVEHSHMMYVYPLYVVIACIVICHSCFVWSTRLEYMNALIAQLTDPLSVVETLR
jgi:hypothetical protein